MKANPIKLLEESIEYLHDLMRSNTFIEMTQKPLCKKKGRLGFIKIKIFFSSKENIKA